MYYKGIKALDKKAEELSKAGIRILDGPRVTGDGYYEFDPSSIEDDVASDVTIDLQGDIVVVGHNGDKWGMIILDENLNQMLANYEGDFGGRSYAVTIDPQGEIAAHQG